MSYVRGYGKEGEYIHVKRLAFENRCLYLSGDVNSNQSKEYLEELLYLGSKSKEPIHLYITSFGGSVHGGMAILDALHYIDCPVYTYCLGYAMSMGAILLTAGTKGHRYCLPHSTVMIHEISTGAIGKLTDLEIDLKESKRLNTHLARIISNTTGQKIEKVQKDMKRDLFLSAEDALKYGLVDEIITRV